MIRVSAFVLILAAAFSPNALAQQPADLDPQIVKLVAAVSEQRLSDTLKKLESFGTRSTLSSTNLPDKGIGAARQWILDEMKSYSPKLQVSFDTYQVAKQGRIPRDIEVRNVMAILPGRSPRRIYVSGHYDTVARPGGQGEANAGGPPRDPDAPAPTVADPNAPLDNPATGVNDDGSGTALTIELARVFSQSGIDFDATLVFMCHVAEEQGLIGARLHAQRAVAEKIPIEAVFNNDIVGGDVGGNGIIDGATIRVYSEGPEDSPSRELARFVQRWGARYVPSHKVRPMARPDRFGRGGDHSAYNQLGFTAVGFRESRENFTRQHDVRDTFEGIALPVPRAERAGECRVGRDARARTAAAVSRKRPGCAADHAGAHRLRCKSQVDSCARRGGLPRVLARGLGNGLAARPAGWKRNQFGDAEYPN